jgi:hypothetical protein
MSFGNIPETLNYSQPQLNERLSAEIFVSSINNHTLAIIREKNTLLSFSKPYDLRYLY